MNINSLPGKGYEYESSSLNTGLSSFRDIKEET